MQTAAAYNPVRARNIPNEMAKLAEDKGDGLTREDLHAEGYTDDQIDKHSHDAAVIYAQRSRRHAA